MTASETPVDNRPRAGGYWKAALALVGVGLIGVASLYPTMRPVAEGLRAMPGAPDFPVPVLQAVLLVNPIILLLLCVAIGTALAPRLGLRSHLAEWARGIVSTEPAFRTEIARAILGGVAAAVAMLVLDALWRPLLGVAGESLSALEEGRPRTFAGTLMGMLYGGITEELLSRWGVMSLFAWALWRLTRRGDGRPHAWTFWTAIVLAAVLFGAGHLGVVAADVGLTPGMVARTVTVNAVGGVVFGWLFWRYSLESAMVAHASVHLVFTLADWAGRMIGVG